MKTYKIGVLTLVTIALTIWLICKKYELKIWELEINNKNELRKIEISNDLKVTELTDSINTLNDSIITLHNQNL